MRVFLSCTKIKHRALPFVKTDRPAPSRRNENFTFNRNYPARSVKSWMVCTKKMVFQQKLLEKPISFSNWLVLQWSGRPVLTNGLSALSFVLKVRVFGTRKLLVTSFLYHEIPQQLTYPKTTFFRRYFALNALKENRIQVFRFAFTYGPAVTVTLVTRPVVPVCRHLTAEWLPRLSGAQSPSRLISSGV